MGMRTKRRLLNRAAIGVLGICLVVMALCDLVQAGRASAAGQDAMRFETVSIRPHKDVGNDPSNREMLPGGRFVATATTVRTLLRVAFMTDDRLISGGPNWIDSDTFDVHGNTENHAYVKTREQFQQLLLSLLEDRFQLKYHRVPKEVPVFWLEVDKAGRLGSGLKPAAPGTTPNMSTNGGTTRDMRVTNMSMSDIAGGFQRAAGRPVEDHTGIPGNFDFEIKWSQDETPESTEASLPAVLKEKLGLKLVAAKGTTESIVIDSLSKPTPN
jgi:uncharacterized protein (TIGR03435 family)